MFSIALQFFSSSSPKGSCVALFSRPTECLRGLPTGGAAMSVSVTLVGPAPWGFRITGGRDFRKPIMVSKVSVFLSLPLRSFALDSIDLSHSLLNLIRIFSQCNLSLFYNVVIKRICLVLSQTTGPDLVHNHVDAAELLGVPPAMTHRASCKA